MPSIFDEPGDQSVGQPSPPSIHQPVRRFIVDEVRAEQKRIADLEAAKQSTDAAAANDRRATSSTALDETAPEVAEACKSMSWSLDGTLFNRGWVFGLQTALPKTYGEKRSDAMCVLFKQDGTWKFLERRGGLPCTTARKKRLGCYDLRDSLPLLTPGVWLTPESIRADVRRALTQNYRSPLHIH